MPRVRLEGEASSERVGFLVNFIMLRERMTRRTGSCSTLGSVESTCSGRLEGVQCLFMREPNWNWMGKGTGWRARSDFVD